MHAMATSRLIDEDRAGMNRMNEESYQVLPFTGLNISVSQLEPGLHSFISPS